MTKILSTIIILPNGSEYELTGCRDPDKLPKDCEVFYKIG